MNFYIKRVGGFFLKLLLQAMAMLIILMPWKLVYWVAAFFAFIAYWILPKYRKIALKNLKMVFKGELAETEQVKIAKNTYINFIKYFLENLKGPVLSKVSIESEERIREALTKGKGVIVYSGHLGNFAVIGRKLQSQGYNFRFVLRAPHDKNMRKILCNMMDKRNIRYIFDDKNTVLRDSLEVLKNNGILFLAGDQYKPGGMEVPFLGLATLFAGGPFVLAQRSGAEILPVFITSDLSNNYVIKVEEKLDLSNIKKLDDRIYSGLLIYSKLLEKYILKYPAQWLWLHRRWKNLEV